MRIGEAENWCFLHLYELARGGLVEPVGGGPCRSRRRAATERRSWTSRSG